MKYVPLCKLIVLNMIPLLLMVGLIPFVLNDYVLTLYYLVIIGISFAVHYEKKEYVVFIFGFVIMIFSEYLFISTGVETFLRNSLLGVMPLWLPFLWAYGFVAIKRSAVALVQ